MNYDWRIDAFRSYSEAIHFLALRAGSKRPRNGFEWYWLEAQGLIP